MKSASALHFLVLCACLFASPAFAQGSTTPSSVAADGRHTLNLKDADIQALIATVSEITGKNFILGPNVQGKVTVISAKPMKPEWVANVQTQADSVGAEFIFKQWGGWGADGVRRHKKANGRELFGRTWDAYPVVQVSA